MAITYFVTFTLGMLIGQDIWQRVFTSRTPAIAKWVGTASAIYATLYAIAGAVIGMAGRVVIPDVKDGHYGEVFALLATGYVPSVLGGIVLAAGVAAMMSTASGALIAAATVTRVDIAPVVKSLLRGGKEQAKAQLQDLSTAEAISEHDQLADEGGINADRIYVLVFGIFVTFMAVFLTDPVMGMVIGYDFLVGGLFVPILGGLIWKRATATDAWTAMIVGTIAVVIGMLTFGALENEPIYIGLGASLVTFVVSLLTPQSSGQSEAPPGVPGGALRYGLLLALQDRASEVRGFGRGLADLDANSLESFLLRLGGARRAGDDGASVSHGLALGSGEARDVADDRLRHAVLDVGRGALLGVATDLTNHDDEFGLGILFERLERIDVDRADDRVATDADARGEADVTQLVHHLVGQGAGLGHEANLARAGDVGRGDADVRLSG
ncbi:hypothetical protein BSZ39_11465 [Bowdeniella nasicola]|uniref:Uncharacterized protein n=1 Tax=Bowdeniella nasicola TaxID=208480 RepID=A0A1Q5PZV9_9ACTO|nr:hypothetical protein BSZ39_11465 [Bowdeniella nasicola]